MRAGPDVCGAVRVFRRNFVAFDTERRRSAIDRERDGERSWRGHFCPAFAFAPGNADGVLFGGGCAFQHLHGDRQAQLPVGAERLVRAARLTAHFPTGRFVQRAAQPFRAVGFQFLELAFDRARFESGGDFQAGREHVGERDRARSRTVDLAAGEVRRGRDDPAFVAPWQVGGRRTRVQMPRAGRQRERRSERDRTQRTRARGQRGEEPR